MCTSKYISLAVEKSVKSLWENHPNLSKFTSQTNEHEPNLSFYVANELWKYFPKFDCDFDVIKASFNNKRPDIIFHKRGTNNKNLLVVEIKRSTNRNAKGMQCKEDEEKITNIWFKEPLKYQYGLSLVLDVEDKKFRGILLCNSTKEKIKID